MPSDTSKRFAFDSNKAREYERQRRTYHSVAAPTIAARSHYVSEAATAQASVPAKSLPGTLVACVFAHEPDRCAGARIQRQVPGLPYLTRDATPTDHVAVTTRRWFGSDCSRAAARRYTPRLTDWGHKTDPATLENQR
jgi:hypothetical protein